ncbi:class I SAM-dependent methyltransferase [Hymenobacter canadensis]|uniref:Class I SAM-dependent methyltransferase n=1 Tax=Hymenobacter canadensis TaxID=2999067 RepID=A0ABY7LRP6_9BACT|nr:class I SAM-dependent methyltransferase [Hymenobacter canadensis]WBA42121.1 class I SAM-dependent methyltransferase [Hymenobacter canadensis]
MLHILPDSGFDRVAAFYDPLARLVYGRALQAAQQAALIAGLPAGTPRVLIIGGGTGWVLAEVLRLRPQAQVLYLEASPRMLARARRQVPADAAAHVEFRLGTEAALDPSERFEVIVTFFLLDLFEPGRLRQLVARLHHARQPSAPWLLADFAAPRIWWQRGLLTAMYGFFRATTGISARRLPPIHQELKRLGLQPGQEQRFFGGMVEAVVWQ